MHSGTVGVKDTGHFDFKLMLAKVIEKKGFCTSLSLIVAGTWPDAVHVSVIGFGLGMNRRITINLRSRSLKNFGLDPFGKPQHVDGAVNIDLGGLNRVVLVMNGGCRAGQVVNLLDFQIQRKGDVVPEQFKIRIP